jgi:hypothetical protein
MPISHAEISANMAPLLQQCDRDTRQLIASLAIAAMLETYSPEERYRALDEAVQKFCREIPNLA